MNDSELRTVLINNLNNIERTIKVLRELVNNADEAKLYREHLFDIEEEVVAMDRVIENSCDDCYYSCPSEMCGHCDHQNKFMRKTNENRYK